MRQRSRLLLLVMPLLPATGAAPLTAQATVNGVVVEAVTHRPIADVLVLLDTTRQVTAADGRFRFLMVAAGTRTLRVRHVAYAERNDTLDVGDGDHIDIRIPVSLAAIELEPLTVDVRSRHLLDVGFYERTARGTGIHVTREQLRESNVTRLADFIARIPGVRRTFVNGERSRIDMRGGRSMSMPCHTQYFLDGAAMAAGASVLDDLSPQNIEGIEIYRGASETPIEFDFGSTTCGAIVIWTRRH